MVMGGMGREGGVEEGGLTQVLFTPGHCTDKQPAPVHPV